MLISMDRNKANENTTAPSKSFVYSSNHRRFKSQLFNAVVFICLFTLMAYLIFSLSSSMESAIPLYQFPPNEAPLSNNEVADQELPSIVNGFDLNQSVIKTFKRDITLEEANENMYHLLNYQIIVPSQPVPRLAYLRGEPTCQKIFSDWIEKSNSSSSSSSPHLANSPPMNFPDNTNVTFTLNGYSAVQYNYTNGKNMDKDNLTMEYWDKIEEIMKWNVTKIAELGYGASSMSLYNAMNADGLDYKKGFVIGGEKPWIEVFALLNGADHVTTVANRNLNIQKEYVDRISSVTPLKVAQNWENYASSFNFAVAFSTLENTGLGQNGDPIDPFGDVREMEKIRCMLKNGGLLFLELPIGTDALVFNHRRIYGPLRLAIMFIGFEWVATYDGTSEQPIDLNSKLLHTPELFSFKKYTLVLKKIKQV